MKKTEKVFNEVNNGLGYIQDLNDKRNEEQLGSAFNNEGEPNAEVKGIPFDKHSDIQDADYEEVSEETKEIPAPESENEEDVSRETSEEDKPTKGGKGSRKPRKPKDQ